MDLPEAWSAAAIAAACEEARAIGVPMNVAVLDGGANLKAFLRMDGALLGSVDIALRKAKTAALFGMNSEAVGEFCKPGGTSPGLEDSNGGLTVFAGGIPLRDGQDRLLGAVGVSGGSVAQDLQVAEAAARGAQALQEKLTWSIADAADSASPPAQASSS
ncbi:GlcG/HbpS family heme-binding protein [Sphingosinicella terrae]|uniref:GlcG/HbpS family heme-binding protein n=1 Tax=Sphingosinicella terrae TaxID=2172047 RepID=UPI000E0DC836|nr:heme-binding protein [Sphingosinicella terrae]